MTATTNAHEQRVIDALKAAFRARADGKHGTDALVYSVATHRSFIDLFTRQEEMIADLRDRITALEGGAA